MQRWRGVDGAATMFRQSSGKVPAKFRKPTERIVTRHRRLFCCCGGMAARWHGSGV